MPLSINLRILKSSKVMLSVLEASDFPDFELAFEFLSYKGFVFSSLEAELPLKSFTMVSPA